MAVKFFGQYLLEKGVITSRQLVDALEYQKQVNLSIHQLALKKGLLTAANVEHALAEQRKSGLTAEQTLLDLGFLTEEQIAQISKEIETNRVFLGEALVAKNIITSGDLERLLKDFHDEQGKVEYKFRDLIKMLEPLEFIDVLGDAVIDTFRNVINKILKIEHYAIQVGTIPKDRWVVELFLLSKNKIRLQYVLTEETILDISYCLGMGRKPEVDEEVKDAIREFISIVMGTAFSRLTEQGLIQNIRVGCLPVVHNPIQVGHDLLRKNRNALIKFVYPSDLNDMLEMDLVIEHIL